MEDKDIKNQDFALNNPDGSFAKFVSRMRKKIESSTEKHGDFTQYNKTQIFDSLCAEFRELLQAISENKCQATIGSECVDVANLAYMLYWAYLHELLELELTPNKWPSYRYE